MLANRLQQHPAADQPDGEAAVVPVLAIQAPPGPDEGRFYNSVLEALYAPYHSREHVAKNSGRSSACCNGSTCGWSSSTRSTTSSQGLSASSGSFCRC